MPCGNSRRRGQTRNRGSSEVVPLHLLRGLLLETKAPMAAVGSQMVRTDIRAGKQKRTQLTRNELGPLLALSARDGEGHSARAVVGICEAPASGSEPLRRVVPGTAASASTSDDAEPSPRW